MLKYKSLKTGKVANVVNEVEGRLILVDEDGKEYKASASTLKRWWKAIEVEEPQTVVAEATEVDAVVAESETIVVDEQTPEPEVVAEKVNVADSAIKCAETLAFDYVSQLFVRTYKKEYNLVNCGVIYLWFVPNRVGFTVCAKSKAIANVELPACATVKHVKHCWDLRIKFDTWNDEIEQLFIEIHNASLDYQLNKKDK